MDNQELVARRRELMSICNQRTKSLVECLTKGDKFELAEITSQLMPNGVADFSAIRHTTPLAVLFNEYGRKDLRMVMFLLVKSFCDSLNVVRNMTEDQMIESASFLIDDCGDMRLEDFQIMFTMAKRGQLIKIMDRVDIDTIGKIYDAYYLIRREAGQKLQEEEYNTFENGLRLRHPLLEEKNAGNVGEDNVDLWGRLVGVMTAWQKEIEEEDEQEKAAMRKRNVEAYATLQKVDIEKIRKDFSKSTTTGSG